MSPSVPAAPTAASRYGNRESKEALAELKTKLEFALSRLNDQDTQRTGIEEIREFLQTLYADWFPMVITSIGEAGTNLKPLGRCESVKLLGLLAELHGDAVIPLLQRMLQVVLTRLQDADLHLREACAETVFRLARALVVDADGSPVFATLLKPLFAALSEHNKWVQIGAASCICAVIQGSPPTVLSENLVRLCSRLVQHLSLPLAMARPQLLSACIHVMQAVNLTEFDEVLPSLMPCLEICLNSTSDWQTRKQAIEVLQAVGDHPELGQSLQIPPANPSVRPTPLQKRLASMMEGLKEDKVRAVREAVKDVLQGWSVTMKVAPSPTATLPGERADRPLRSSSPCAAQIASSDNQKETWQRLSGVSVRSNSPGPASWERDQARLSEGSTAQGSRQTRNVRAATRERDMGQSMDASKFEDDRPADKQERHGNFQFRLQDAAAEKAARNIAVKNALSNADLSSTKKPRPKRERASIFSQKANSNFFQSAGQHAPATGDDVEDVVVGMPGMSMAAEDRLLSSPGSDNRRGARAATSDQEDVRPAAAQEGSDAGTAVSADALAQEPAQALPDDEGTDEGTSSQALQEFLPDDDCGRKAGAGVATRATKKPVRRGGKKEEDLEDSKPARQGVRQGAAQFVANVGSECPDAAGDFETLSPSPTSSAPAVQQEPEPDVADASSCPPDVQAAGAGEEVAAPDWSLRAEEPPGQEKHRAAARSSRPAVEHEEQLATLFSHVQALQQRLVEMEDEKRRHDRQMTERLQQLVRTCEGQGELISTQQQRLQEQEQQIHLLEDELSQMDQQLQEQQLQLQQQDQRLEQNDQQLNEHQQQLEQQEQDLEKQIMLTDALVNSTASSSSSVKPALKQVWQDEESKSNVSTAKRWAETWKSDAEASRVTSPLPGPLNSDGAATVGSGGALAGSSSERPLALVGRAKVDTASAKVPNAGMKAGGQLWEAVMELCVERRFLEAYKQVIAEPEETCLLRLMKHTGPIVDRLDAESNSRLIRRLIHILSSPAKEPAAASIEQIFSWLWQALNQGIHFTASQVEDLVSALQKVSSAQSLLSAQEKAEAAQLLQQVSAHRRT